MQKTKWPQHWSANLYVEKNSKNVKLKSEIFQLAPKIIRIDVSTTIDVPVATVLLTDKTIQYLLYKEKKYYSGEPNPRALDPVFPLEVDVETLVLLLNEIPPVGQTSYQVKWEKRSIAGPLAGRATRVTLEFPHRNVSLKFYFTDWRSNVSNVESLAKLEIPNGFKSFAVPKAH